MSALGVDEYIVEKPGNWNLGVQEGRFLYLTCKFHMQVRCSPTRSSRTAFHGQPLFATVRLSLHLQYVGDAKLGRERKLNVAMLGRY